MIRHGLLLGLLVLGTVTIAAQDATELRGTGGELSMIPKKTSGFSGSLGLTFGKSDGLFSGSGNRVNGTLGATLVKDKVWMFASAEQQSERLGSLTTPVAGSGNAVDAKVMATLGDRQSLSAMFAQNRQPAATRTDGVVGTLPSSFLSMHYTGIVSDSMFFTASVSRQSVKQSGLLLTAPGAGQ